MAGAGSADGRRSAMAQQLLHGRQLGGVLHDQHQAEPHQEHEARLEKQAKDRLRMVAIVMAVAAAVALVLAVCAWAPRADAQDLTPRAYWPAPKGTKVAIAGYSRVSGDVLFDPSIPLFGVDSKIGTAIVGYFQTFSLWGRTATIVVDLPYSWGTTQGLVEDAIPELPLETQGIYAVYPPGRFTQPKVRAFIDFLVHSFADKGPDQW